MIFQYLTFISLLIAAGALAVSTLTYRRNRRFENENHLFRTKTDVYGTLTRKAYEVVSAYEDAYFEVKEGVRSGNMRVKDIERYLEELDIKAYRFEKEAAFHALLLTQAVSDSIEAFVDAVIHDQAGEAPGVDTLREGLLGVYEKVEGVVNGFRKDLNVEVLNESLFRRIR